MGNNGWSTSPSFNACQSYNALAGEIVRVLADHLTIIHNSGYMEWPGCREKQDDRQS